MIITHIYPYSLVSVKFELKFFEMIQFIDNELTIIAIILDKEKANEMKKEKWMHEVVNLDANKILHYCL